MHESFYQAIVEQAGVGINQADATGRFIQVNQKFCDLLGYTRAELLQKTYAEVTHPEDLYKNTCQLQDLLAGKIDFFTTEKRYLHKDGTPIWTQVTFSYLQDEQGNLLSDLAIVEDIRDRKRIEAENQRIEEERKRVLIQQRLYLQELAAWRRRYEIAGRASGQILFEYDLTHDRDIWGPNTEILFGYRAEEMPQGLGQFIEHIHPDDRAQFQSIIEMDWVAIQPYRVEYRFRCRDGSYKWVEERGQTCVDEQGLPISVIGVIEDISVAKQAALALTEAKEAADAANRAKSTFLANMSHELRTPLHIVLGYAQVLRRDPTCSEAHQEILDIILQSGDHLLDLINDVLNVTKIEARQLVPQWMEFNLLEFLRSLEIMVQVQARAKGLHLKVEVSPDVPSHIASDSGKLRQILLNLVGNAIKFTEQGWVCLRVGLCPIGETTAPFPHPSEVWQRVNPATLTWLQFEVEDTGMGIPEAALDKIFEPFHQIHHRNTVPEGTGLGLTISRKYIELMGGDISVRSTPGQGSTFWIRLPVQPVRPRGCPSLPSSGKELVAMSPYLVHYRVLLVDDALTNRKVLMKILQPLGCSIAEATNGQEAVTIWERWRPHLVVMDIRMPIMDGYEATRQIRLREAAETQELGDRVGPQRTCIIALTADILESDRSTCLEVGCDDMLAKPLKQSAFFNLLAQHLNLHLPTVQPTTATPYTAPIATRLPLNQFHQILAVQPPSWQQDLYHATVCCDDTQIQRLLQTLPPEGQIIADVLKPLLYDFRFDQILQLLQSSLSTAPKG